MLDVEIIIVESPVFSFYTHKSPYLILKIKIYTWILFLI